MKRFGAVIVIVIVTGIAVALGCGTTQESDVSSEATGSACKSEIGDITPAQCKAHQQKECDLDDASIRKQIDKWFTKGSCKWNCGQKAADLQKRVCEADIKTAVEACTGAGFCFCDAVIGGSDTCGLGWLCREAYLSECIKKCDDASYPFDPKKTECAGLPMDPPDPPKPQPPRDAGVDGGGSGSDAGSGG